jgi:hypothetical protein
MTCSCALLHLLVAVTDLKTNRIVASGFGNHEGPASETVAHFTSRIPRVPTCLSLSRLLVSAIACSRERLRLRTQSALHRQLHNRGMHHNCCRLTGTGARV